MIGQVAIGMIAHCVTSTARDRWNAWSIHFITDAP
jgi:hypothetical protein